MAEIVYTPKSLESKDSELTGTVTLRVPTLPERLKYIEDAKVDLSQEEFTAELFAKNSASTRVLLELSKAHYVAINIKEKKGDVEHTTFDSLCEDNRADGLLMEVAWLLVRGFSPSKKSKAS